MGKGVTQINRFCSALPLLRPATAGTAFSLVILFGLGKKEPRNLFVCKLTKPR